MHHWMWKCCSTVITILLCHKITIAAWVMIWKVYVEYSGKVCLWWLSQSVLWVDISRIGINIGTWGEVPVSWYRLANRIVGSKKLTIPPSWEEAFLALKKQEILTWKKLVWGTIDLAFLWCQMLVLSSLFTVMFLSFENTSFVVC